VQHELEGYFQDVARTLALEYRQIRDRVSEDPGTAGDRAEESWATVLRSWLPSDFPVVTKGRVLGYDGTTSPQVDVLVLDPGYPEHLRTKKLYLAGGVIAVFECKLTLRKIHLAKTFRTLQSVKEIGAQRPPYREELELMRPSLERELSSPIICGVLAHSQAITRITEDPRTYWKVVGEMDNAAHTQATSPRGLADLICIADCVSLYLEKETCIGPVPPLYYDDKGPKGEQLTSAYYAQRGLSIEGVRPSVIGGAVFYLFRLLARQRPTLRRLADYYHDTGIQGISTGAPRSWPLDKLSPAVLQHLREHGGSRDQWSEWTVRL
jgi:hypothetical protein